MTNEPMPARPCLPEVRGVLEDLRKAANEKPYNGERFCDAVWSCLAVLCETPGGEAMLRECSEFVLRNTADGTTYALAWQKGRKRFRQWAERAGSSAKLPAWFLLEEIERLRTVEQQLAWASELESVRDWLKVVFRLADPAELGDVRANLDEWHSETKRVIGLAHSCRADGCRLLLEMHERGLESAELAVLTTPELGACGAELIVEAAEFLADPSSYEGDRSSGGTQQPAVKQGHVVDKRSRYRPPPCPECGKRARVTSKKPTYRNLRCRTCEHTWQEPH